MNGSQRSDRIPVVGLGASAGGIKALRELIANVPPESGIAWVVILHLSPDHDSKLADVLQSSTSMGVTQVDARTAIESDHVYVIPPNKSLEIKDDQLVLNEITRAEHRRSPVDVFFRALADAHGSESAAVVLSGTGPNGSAGLKRIKEYGGLTIAQDPAQADYNDMPRNAIATGLVDFVLPVAQIPSQIIKYFIRVEHEGQERIDDPARADEAGALREVMALVRVRTGHDFSNYKAGTFRRRVDRRMHLRRMTTLSEYARLVRQQPDESVALMKELLISVTNFFRDAPAWTVLDQRIIPRLFAGKGEADQVRVWVAGCATGEEAYSMAMLLTEHRPELPLAPSIQIFASDLDEHAIATAREGLYTNADVADVSEERLARFFETAAGGYRVRRELREMMLFARHNLISDPPFSHLDLISCRNLLIYLNRPVQERIIETFHFALRPAGFLFLGLSESPDGSTDQFICVDANSHIYESRAVTNRLPLPHAAPTLSTPAMSGRASEPRPAPGARIFPGDLHQRLLEQYAAPSVVITEEHNIVHASESAGRFMQVPGGEPSRELVRLVRPDLRSDLRAALSQSARDRAAVAVPDIAVAFEDTTRLVDVEVRPVLREGEPGRGYFLVFFHEHAPRQASGEAAPAETLRRDAEPASRPLEDELARVKEQLRVSAEQYETQVEEAKASNEELQAMNEELRSSAEELEIGKEELQSVNEELTTVNQELKIKIEELGIANNDLQNLINSTDIGTIFLDRSLKVKFFTPRAQDIFNLLPTDVGRPLSNITSTLKDGSLHEHLRTVLERLQTVEREVERDDGRWFLMRVLPYRTLQDRIEGVVVTFQDVSTRRDAETRLRQSEERLRLLIDSAVDYAIFTMTEDAQIDSWNPGAQRVFGYEAGEIIGRPVDVLFTTEDRALGMPARDLDAVRKLGHSADERFLVRKDGSQLYITGSTIRLGRGGVGFAKIGRDLTEPREAAQALRSAHVEMNRRIRDQSDEFEVERLSTHALLRRVVSAQEDERRRISRDLHDSLGQQLTALRLTLERHQRHCPDPNGDSAVADALSLTRSVNEQIDFLASELRPAVLDDLGLDAALPRFVDAWAAHGDVRAECRFDGFTSHQLTPEAEVAFYRIVQEALNNVSKHAHATRVDVVITARAGQVVLVVEDDGIGFDASSDGRTDGIGLVTMRERAMLVGASLEIESIPGKGTSVFVRMPVMPQESSNR
jgi:two-component system, chemotaxis family, CheB/CheR fusion protein